MITIMGYGNKDVNKARLGVAQTHMLSRMHLQLLFHEVLAKGTRYTDMAAYAFAVDQSTSGNCKGEFGGPIVVSSLIDGRHKDVQLSTVGYIPTIAWPGLPVANQCWGVRWKPTRVPAFSLNHYFNYWRRTHQHIPWFNPFLWIEERVERRATIVKVINQ